MKNAEINSISTMCKNFQIGKVVRNTCLSAQFFKDDLFEELELVYGVTDRKKAWGMITEALEEKEWVINFFDNNFIVTDRWGK